MLCLGRPGRRRMVRVLAMRRDELGRFDEMRLSDVERRQGLAKIPSSWWSVRESIAGLRTHHGGDVCF